MNTELEQKHFVHWMLANMRILSISDKKAILEGLEDLIAKEELSKQLKYGRE